VGVFTQISAGIPVLLGQHDINNIPPTGRIWKLPITYRSGKDKQG